VPDRKYLEQRKKTISFFVDFVGIPFSTKVDTDIRMIDRPGEGAYNNSKDFHLPLRLTAKRS